MNFSVVGVTKFVVSGIVGIGAGKIVAQVIKTHITPETILDKVTVTAAAWVIGAMASEATKNYTGEVVDSVAEAITTVVDKVKTNAKLGRIKSGDSTFEKEGLDPSKFEKNEKGLWVSKKDDEEIEFEEVVGMIRSNEWNYDVSNNYWFRKNKNGKTDIFRQLVEEVGTNVKWVWYQK